MFEIHNFLIGSPTVVVGKVSVYPSCWMLRHQALSLRPFIFYTEASGADRYEAL